MASHQFTSGSGAGRSRRANLHKGTGVGAGWILLVDTLAVSLILLPLTGVALWGMVNRRRMIGTGIAVVSIASAICLRCRQSENEDEIDIGLRLAAPAWDKA